MSNVISSRPVFAAASALLFAASVALTIVWCASMPAMGGMPMPGGWTMSMMWMRMPGQSWLGSAASFVGMWTVMMVAMMSPSLAPSLSRYRHGALMAIASAAYFIVWMLAGVAAFGAGAILALIEMRSQAVSRIVPLAAAVVVIIAATLQLTKWKSLQLSRCRDIHDVLPSTPFTALRHGVKLGVDCVRSCANLMIILLVFGVMDLRVMAAITAVITVERLAPSVTRPVSKMTQRTQTR